ncbi:hypothetical protein [Sphingorhabdus sp. Alg239-R122]|uniref:hypothetical protein n=1 Tax=Sphingorhabdus sp. Alg239-R122 TaxID=2305989 RepID=UPI0013DA968D|nr:hypothetical protein [Sphingorhabdus sp. Alg239-R122]
MDWLVLAGSLIAIFAVAALVHYLRLGEAALRDSAHAMRLAEDNLSGFEASWAILSTDGAAAVVHGADDDIALVKRHGAQFALRKVVRPLRIVQDGNAHMVDSGELSFGRVSFMLTEEDADKLLTLM